MSGIESQQEKNQKIANISAQFIHDITTPLVTIKMLASMLETYLPTALSAYQQLKEQGAHIGDIPQEQLSALESSTTTIKNLAQQVNKAARDYWQQIDEQTSSSDNTEIANTQIPTSNNKQASTITLENSLRILIAEDDAIHQKIASKLLSVNHQIDIAANGREAVNYCRQKSYDLILMDLQMPIMDGSQAVAEIIKSTNPPPLIIGLTNRPLGNERKQLLQQGFNSFIEKPLRIDELSAAIKALQTSDTK